MPARVVDFLELVDVEDEQRERRFMRRSNMANMPRSVSSSASPIAHAGQRIGANFGEGEQLVGLLPQILIGLRELRGEPLRGAEHLLDFAVQIVPGALARRRRRVG